MTSSDRIRQIYRLACFSLLSGGLTLQAHAISLDLNSLTSIIKNTSSAISGISEEKELKVGKDMSATLLGAMPLVKHDKLQNYLNSVGVWVAQQSGRAALNWHFALVDDTGINAFAAPGGYIFVTRGLFAILQNEAELAGVIGHEIAHVVKKHHLNAMQKAAQRALAGDLLVALAKENDRQALDTLVGAGTKIYARGLDRDDELEADRIGVVLATRAGYQPFSLLDVLTTIDSIGTDNADIAFFAATHPPTGDRIMALDGLMGKQFEPYSYQPLVENRFNEAKKLLLSIYASE